MADTVILAEQTLTFAFEGEMGTLIIAPVPFVLEVGETYRVVMDGTAHELACVLTDGAQCLSHQMMNESGDDIGDGTFIIAYVPKEVSGLDTDSVQIMVVDSTNAESHTLAISHLTETEDPGEDTVNPEDPGEDPSDITYLIKGSTLTAIANAIRAKTGKTEAISVPNMPYEIAGITMGSGPSADVCYVTFMNQEGTKEYGRKTVAVGDDCADPIVRGLFSTPTRESTAQYSYTFYGWATTPNGAADVNWYKSITEDKTVYANFVSTVRYYTITYYDGDVVLKTESLPYGTMPNYVAEKGGFNFEGWEPALTTVTGDASYHAQFSTAITFAGASWADIAEISAAGTAADTFSVGDEKPVPITYADGTTATMIVKIAGFNHDDLVSGGKAGISIVCRTVPDYTTVWSSTTNTYYKDSLVATALSENGDIWNMLPQELMSVIKPVVKKYDKSLDSSATPTLGTMNASLWALAIDEVGMTGNAEGSNPGSKYVSKLGARYELFPALTQSSSGTPTSFQYLEAIAPTDQTKFANSWTRNILHNGTMQAFSCSASYTYSANRFSYSSTSSYTTSDRGIWFGFCV